MNSLTELKKIIQSIDKNITDVDIDFFQKQLSQLGQQYKKNPTVTSFLKMMRSIGNYLDSKKNKAHTDTIPVLNSIARQLEKIINDRDLKKDEARQVLSKEIQKYKSLKNQIISKPEITDNDINDLKVVILAIDWEISDTTIQNFEKVAADLLFDLKNYKIHHTFLKIIHSTGRYIGNQKANAHTDSISFLRSVFDNFELIVQTPDMSFKDKKQILETDINRFHEFKHKISLKKKRAALTADATEDESIQPALSHVKQTDMPAINDVVPLTTLPESEDLLAKDKPDSGTIEPALANKKKSPVSPRDVMDDLFSIKESPADELLDAIHLLDVHVPNQDQDLGLLDDRTEDLQSNGIKNFTPQRMDNEPIPEIGNRLDEFFSLDDSSDNMVITDEKTNLTAEVSPIANDGPADGIVPFQHKDESFEESLHKSDDNEPLPQYPDSDILSRLKSSIETSEWLRDGSSILSINQDISFLEKRWQNDPEKICLLQIISSLTNVLKSRPETIQQENENKIKEADKSVSDTSRKKTGGIWKKIKKTFTS